MTSFTQFIITRYALRWPGRPLVDADWLTHRRPLFEAYCLPSVAAQSVQDFVWLVFYDETLTELTALCEGWQTVCPQLVAVPTADDFGNFHAGAMREAMRANLVEGSTHAISTRLDNDDMITPDYLALVRDSVDRKGLRPERYFVNFDVGLNLTLATGEYEPHPHRHNMFASCVEPVDDLQGILSWAHNSLPKVGEMVHRTEEGRWIHIIHERNEWPPGRTV